PLTHEREDLGSQELAMTPASPVGGQDAFIHPALDRAHADAQGGGGMHGAQVRGLLDAVHGWPPPRGSISSDPGPRFTSLIVSALRMIFPGNPSLLSNESP